MASLGTRKFYKTHGGLSDIGNNQILKNSGYISIVLHSVFYNSKGNFWQNIFGGIDNIVLSSSISYKSSKQTINAQIIQDKQTVKVNHSHFLALSRLIALKIPSNADGLELKISMTAIKDDSFENSINLMNSKEFQEPLQLSPIPIGQILSITKIVKKILTGIEKDNHLEATFSGIISRDKVENAVEKEKLTAGYLILISNNDDNSDALEHLDITALQVDANGLKYKNKRLEHTNIIYSITFDPLKGIDEFSNWFEKYKQALSKLDEISFVLTEEEKKKILIDSKKLWIEGSALLFNDSTYIFKEQQSIKGTYFKKIIQKYKELTLESSESTLTSFLGNEVENLDFIPNIKIFDSKKIDLEVNILADEYIEELGKAQMIFPE